MSNIEELQEATRDLDTLAFLRFVITDEFQDRTIATCSLRARSVVLLKLISTIDPSTPVAFCHAQELLPESVSYRQELVDQLGLRDIRDPVDEDEHAPSPGDCYHGEGLWSENPVDRTRAYTTVRLNRTLADFDCWISGVYHGPYSQTPAPRVTKEGRLVRLNPLASWTQIRVREFMEKNGLRYHPRSPLRLQARSTDTAPILTYHF